MVVARAHLERLWLRTAVDGHGRIWRKAVAAWPSRNRESSGHRYPRLRRKGARYRAIRRNGGEEIAETEQIVRETVCELANMVIGNAVTLLNDRGFKFKVFPPTIHADQQIPNAGAEVEAMVLAFATEHGSVFINIALHYLRRRSNERRTVAVS